MAGLSKDGKTVRYQGFHLLRELFRPLNQAVFHDNTLSTASNLHLRAAHMCRYVRFQPKHEGSREWEALILRLVFSRIYASPKYSSEASCP